MKIKSIHMYMLMLSIFGLGGLSLLNQTLLASAETTPTYTNYHSFSGSGWIRQEARLEFTYDLGVWYYTEYWDLDKYWSVGVSDQDTVEGYSSTGVYRLYIEGTYSYFCWPSFQYRDMRLSVYFDESTEEFWHTTSNVPG